MPIRFADARAIRKNRVEVIATLDEIIATETLEVWAQRLDQAGVWWAPAQGPAEVLADPGHGGVAVTDAAHLEARPFD